MLASIACLAAGVQARAASSAGSGLDPVPFAAANRSRAPIACEAALAHWYSASLGRAGPGGTVSAMLWSDRRTGTVVLVAADGARIPVLAVWCGIEGRATSTRSDIALVRRAGQREPAIEVDCGAGARPGELACRRSSGR